MSSSLDYSQQTQILSQAVEIHADRTVELSTATVRTGASLAQLRQATFHIGFIQETEEQVNKINQSLRDSEFEVPAPSRQHGSWTFYFTAPGGFLVEVLG